MLSTGVAPDPGSTFTAEDGTVSTVLPENYDPNYEPTQEELEDYAQFLGIDPATEPELLWIAKEGLRTPLPGEWRACQTNEDEVYYFNFQTGESLWDHPMDDVFKEKAQAERAKLQAGKRTGKGASASGGGVGGASAAATTRSSSASAGSTKAIADSLFGRPAGQGSKHPPPPPPLGRPGLAQPLSGGLRTVPDVSDILGLSTSGSAGGGSLQEPGSSLGGLLGGGRPPAFSSPTTSAPPALGAKAIEANIRRRVEEEYAPKRRQLNIDHDRKHMEEKHAMEEELKAYKRELDAAWDIETSKSSAQRNRDLQRELKEIEESWAKRIKTVGDQVADATKALEARRAEVSGLRAETTTELKKKLDAQRAEEVARKRALLQAAVDEEVARVTKEQEETLKELKRREAAAVSSARATVEEENAAKLKLQQTQNEKLLAGIEAEIAALQKELSDYEGGSPATASSASPAVSGEPTANEAAVAKRIAAAEAEADAAVELVASACSSEYTALQKSLREEEDRLKKELDAVGKSGPTSARGGVAVKVATMSSPATEGPPSSSLTEEEEEKLRMEEERLRKELESAVQTFHQQTDALVARQQRQRPSTMSTSGSSSHLENSPPSGGGFGPASQHQRGATTSLTPLGTRLQQLESRHEERMRQLREENKKAFLSAKIPYPRESENYAKGFVAQQKAWNAENPAPSADSILPKLDPVPRFLATMGEMAEVPPPTAQEVKAAMDAKLADLRRNHKEQQEATLARLEKEKQAELDRLESSYREKRLREVKAAVTKREKELAASAPAVVTTGNNSNVESDHGDPEALAAANHKAADALTEAQAKVDAAKSNLQQSKADMSRAEAAHTGRLAAIRSQLTSLDRQIAALTESVKNAATPVAPDPSPRDASGEKAAAATAAAETIEVTQPDYANYITSEEASAEEAAVHATWRVLLEGLRRDIREVTVARPTAAVPIATRPPTAPVTAAHAASVSYATPLQSRANPYTARGGAAEDDAATAGAATGHTPLHQQAFGHPLYSVNASSIRPSPVPSRMSHAHIDLYDSPVMGMPGHPFMAPGGGASMMSREPRFMSPATATASGFLPSGTGVPGARASTTVTPFPQPDTTGAHPAPAHGAPATASVSPLAVREYDDWQVARPEQQAGRLQRVAQLHSLLRQRRRELKARQAQLESLREDWRRDMQACKQRGDRKQAATLKEVKSTLEKEAKVLNREVLSLKEASQRLKEEERRLRGDGDGHRGTSSSPAGVGLRTGHSADSTAVLETLLRVVERTERLETFLLNHTLSQQRQEARDTTTTERPERRQDRNEPSHRSPSGRKSLGTPKAEHRRDVLPAPSPDATIRDAHPRHEGKIERWLEEQQPRR